MKILDRVLIFANNSFINQVKQGIDLFPDLEKTVRIMNQAVKAQTELQKVEIARGRNNNTDKELETEEDDFFKEIVDVQTKANNREDNNV